jgi:general secretion pathway protein G
MLKRKSKGRWSRNVGVRIGEAGYSLLEVLIVISIVALIAALVGPRLVGQLDRSKVTAARVQLRSLAASLETMRLDIGRYPTDREGLDLLVRAPRTADEVWRGPYLDAEVPQDPWGGNYLYVAPTAEGKRPRLICLGSDLQEGGSGLASDIVYGDPE